MKIISFVQRRTTTDTTAVVAAIADHLSGAYRRSILVVDLDPQGQLTAALLGYARWAVADAAQKTAADGSSLHPLDRVVGASPCALVASSPRLAEVELEPEGRDLSSWIGNFRGDFVLVQTPPSLGGLTRAALAGSHAHVVLTEPTQLSASGLATLPAALGRLATSATLGTVLCAPVRWPADRQRLIEIEQEPTLAPVWAARVKRPLADDTWRNPGPMPLSVRWSQDYLAITEELVRRAG